MTVTLTYDPVLSRVRITADSLAAADYATVERSTDQIFWTTVRGGVEAAVSAGSLVTAVDDYEFVSGVPNYYRVRGIETDPITFVAAGVGATGNNTSLVPAHPAGLVVGDLKIIFATIRNNGAGVVNTPSGWTLIRQFGQSGGLQRNGCLLGRVHQSADVAPTVTFTGGVAGADTLAQMCALRSADLAAVTGIDQLNSSAQDAAYPALAVPAPNQAVLDVVWKQDDYSAITLRAGHTLIGTVTSTAGDDAGMTWSQHIQTTAVDQVSGTHTVTGGAAAISRTMTIVLQHAPFLNEQTANITPVLDSIWLKSVTRPFLNRKVTVVDWSPEERPSRTGGFPVVGRTLEVAVTDVAGGLVFDLDLHVSNRDDAQTLDYVRASGDILFLHTPAGCEVPGGHVCLDTTAARRIRARGSSRVFTLPLRQCAAPGPDVVGATSTWQTVLSSYPSWAALLAANPTWADLLARVAPPSEVIVP